MVQAKQVEQLCSEIYGKRGSVAYASIMALLENVRVRSLNKQSCFSEKDIVLITYADSLRRIGEPPIRTLHSFASKYLKASFSAIHFLPFFPYSSDDGFSVMDYLNIDSALGDWENITQCGNDFNLMFDFVLNHISAQSHWFERYLKSEAGYSELAIEIDPSEDVSMVTRPRALPLLTLFTKQSGEKVNLWTTFSADQIDLNYSSIDVLCHMIQVLLFYIEKGARYIRMDAIAYLWKQLGTPCIHLPQTHAMVKLFRAILDLVAPETVIITETNVPHAENISYFGNGSDEAQMVYNFTLPPLLLHTFIEKDSRIFSRWVRELKVPSEKTAFFNFTASHDGIGVRPLEGILTKEQIDYLAQAVIDRGGQVSYKQNSDGSESPYELNVTYVDALSIPGQEGTAVHAARFLAAQAIPLCLPGVPAVYIHSLLGSRNWYKGRDQTGRARTINREKMDVDALAQSLADPESFRSCIFNSYCRMLELRRKQSAFHPNASWDVLSIEKKVFAIKRQARNQIIFAITNIDEKAVALSLGTHCRYQWLYDLLDERRYAVSDIKLMPYQTVWLTQID